MTKIIKKSTLYPLLPKLKKFLNGSIINSLKNRYAQKIGIELRVIKMCCLNVLKLTQVNLILCIGIFQYFTGKVRTRIPNESQKIIFKSMSFLNRVFQFWIELGFHSDSEFSELLGNWTERKKFLYNYAIFLYVLAPHNQNNNFSDVLTWFKL